MSLAEKLQTLEQQIREAEAKHQRPPRAVSLLVVSKNRRVEELQELIKAGQHRFGENYLQEALEKITALNNPNLEWHFIGRPQSNKTRPIAEHFTWLHTLTSEKIAMRLNEQRPATLPPLQVCIQVNISKDPNKAGLIEFQEIEKLASACQNYPRLQLRGLMTLIQANLNEEEQGRAFHQMQTYLKQLNQNGFNLDTLSMGTSQDWQRAIAEGATMIRIGRGL